MTTTNTTQVRRPERFLETYGPWAVVTGASDGIGEAAARILAATGLSVVLVARRAGLLDNLAEDIKNNGGTALAVPADLSVPVDIDRVHETTDGLDVGLLFAAAGFGTSGPFPDGNLDRELAMIDVNCRAVASMTHHYAQRFSARGRGGVVLMSSLVGFQGVPGSANYAATKAYIQSFAEGIRPELVKHGVDVLASAPGPVDSGFAKAAGMSMGSTDRADVVALGSLNALGRKRTVRPGRVSKTLGWSLSTAPRRLRTKILKQVMQSFTSARPA